MTNIKSKLDKKIEKVKRKLPLDVSFDIMGREICIGNEKGYFIFIDGFAKDEVLYYYLSDMQKNVKEIRNLDDFLAKEVSYIETEKITKDSTYDKLVTYVLSGVSVLILENFEDYILLDTREYPVRSISESETEKVVRGSKDCFVETIVLNTALIRRRIKSQNLIFEMVNVGNYSKTDIAISYVNDLVNKEILKNLKTKLKKINSNSLILNSQNIEELLFEKQKYNPLPKVKYTERPDVASSYLAEGHIVLLIDTSPVAIILPVSIFYFFQNIGDYNTRFLNGTVSKILRIFSILLATFLAPIVIYLVDYTNILSSILEKGDVKQEDILFSFFVQIIILEIVFIVLQMASLHIPTAIASMMGIVGGLLLGEITITMGFFTPVSLLTMLVTVLTTYTIPSLEFSDSIRIFRFFYIISVGLFGILGLIVSIILSIVIAVKTETISGAKRYTYPLIPFNKNDFKNLLYRQHTSKNK